MTAARLTPEQVVERFTTLFGDAIKETRIGERREGSRKNPNYNIWIDIDRAALKPAIEALIDIHFPHLSVISGNDLGETIRLIYHFSIYYGIPHGEYMVTLAIQIPKEDLTVPTISDLIPGAVFSEREKQEFLGIKVIDIPDDRRLFLPEDFPEGVYPWRKDETGIPDSMVKNLWASGRPTDRPAPPAEEKESCSLEDEREEGGGKPLEGERKETKEAEE
ncbi:MAG TPA: NADH-quinone oxidoreductase subunit C [Methanoregulaceae archaeon]|nr:NADH-quinone oxidoreductase subunit C [Methanoregulaceae archaeon]